MDLIIESFKRLYRDGQIDDNTLLLMVKNGVITENDKNYIVQEDDK